MPPKKINESDNIPFRKKRLRQGTPLSDGGDIQQAESELSGMEQYFTDASQSSHKDVMSSSSTKGCSEEQLFTPHINPNNFASLQNYLHSKGMEYSSTDLENLSIKDDLEASLKEMISIDILNEENTFTCDTCEARALGKDLVLILSFYPVYCNDT